VHWCSPITRNPENEANNRMSRKATEPFAEFRALDRGIPHLGTWTNRNTMHVHWGDGSLWDYSEFATVLDSHGMDVALLSIWDRYKPQCGRRACFVGGGGPHGCMTYVPIEAGLEAAAVVRKYFTEALEVVAAGITQAEKLGVSFWNLHWNRGSKAWEVEERMR
jgi:hypothetical protein